VNVPALMYTTNLHDDYHTPRDDRGRIDYAKLTRMAQWMYLTGWFVATAPAATGTRSRIPAGALSAGSAGAGLSPRRGPMSLGGGRSERVQSRTHTSQTPGDHPMPTTQAAAPTITSAGTRPATPRKLFVTLPVGDLQRAVTFYEALGFTFHPQFTDATRPRCSSARTRTRC
jgi:hypothetical protein